MMMLMMMIIITTTTTTTTTMSIITLTIIYRIQLCNKIIIIWEKTGTHVVQEVIYIWGVIINHIVELS